MVAYWHKINVDSNGQVTGYIKVVQNVDSTLSTTPSMVFYQSEDKFCAGNPAKIKQVSNFGNVMYDSKRILGKKFSDKKL